MYGISFMKQNDSSLIFCTARASAQERFPTYHNWDAMEADVHVLVSNAHQYNQEGSEIYEDASRLLVCIMPHAHWRLMAG
jgi:hypothetical protein